MISRPSLVPPHLGPLGGTPGPPSLGPHRGTGRLQGLEGLLTAALLLHTLSLQVALPPLLQEAAVGASDPLEQRQCLLGGQEHCGRRGVGQRPQGPRLS